MEQQDRGSVSLPTLLAAQASQQHEGKSAHRDQHSDRHDAQSTGTPSFGSSLEATGSTNSSSSAAGGEVAGTAASGATGRAAAAAAPAGSAATRHEVVSHLYSLGDAAGAARCHETIDLEAVPEHQEDIIGSGGEYIQSFVLGGLDGILSTFALVAGLGGARTDIVTLLAVSLAKVLADAFSMGFGVYTSTNAELEHARLLKARETWEVDNYEDGELREMCQLYMQKGCSKQDSLTILTTMIKYKELFVDHMMVVEHGVLPPPAAGRWEPLKQGAVCFIAFIFFGLVPVVGFLLLYLFCKDAENNVRATLVFAYAITVVTLFAMGVIKARLTGQGRSLQSGVVMVFNGTVAGGAAYAIGEILTRTF